MCIRLFVAAALATMGLAACTGSAAAGDVPPRIVAPVPVSVFDTSSPSASPAPGCATCVGGVGSGCVSRGAALGRIHYQYKAPYTTQLAPGGCFGYFPTQWRKWDEVCPQPQPVVVPVPVTPSVPPRTVEPKMPEPVPPGLKNGGSDLPPIPVPPPRPIPGKFSP
jgi:hypothetical protein